MVLSRSARQAVLALGQLGSTLQGTGQQFARGISGSSASLQQAAPQAPPSDTIEVFVNDQPVKIPKGASVLQACDAAGIDIPR